MQKSKIADSVSLLTGCPAIFYFYMAKAIHEQVAKRIANAAWHKQLRYKLTCKSLFFTRWLVWIMRQWKY